MASVENRSTRITKVGELDTFTKSGTVIDHQTDSTTQVYGSVNNGHGRISSSTTDYQTLFVRRDDGSEFSTVLQDFSVPARVGSRVSIIYAGHRGADSGWVAGFLNHDTGREDIREETIRLLAPMPKSGCLLIIAPIVAFMVFGQIAFTALGFGGDTSAVALILTLVWLVSPFVTFVIMRRRGRRLTRDTSQLQAQIRSAIQRQLDSARSAPPSAAKS